MSRDAQRLFARILAALSGVLVAAGVLIATGDYLVGRWRAPEQERRIAALQEQVREDASLAPKLADEQKSISEARRARKARGGRLAILLIAASATFLTGVKWLQALGGRQPLPMNRLVRPSLGRTRAARQPSSPKRPPGSPGGQPAAEVVGREGPRKRVHRYPQIRVALGACSLARGGTLVHAALEQEAVQAGAGDLLKVVGCNGMCFAEPMVEVVEAGGRTTLYANVSTEVARRIARRHIRPRRLAAWLRWTGESLAERLARDGRPARPRDHELDRRSGPAAAFLNPQKRIVLENCGQIDPLDLDDYLARDGYGALKKCLQHFSPEQVVAVITDSGLRGRGGAGVPSGGKWLRARALSGSNKCVIGYSDEGDPRGFAGRLLLESDPHRVLEGLAIAAYAIGADHGYIHIRPGYRLALERVRRAVQQAEERGLLGRRILGGDFSLRLEVREAAAGAAAAAGAQDQPALVHHVETLAAVPWIIRHGAEAFAALGAGSSRGTKLFAAAGRIRRPGLIEAPLGITMREIVEDIGGGIQGGGRFKAAQVGGPCGGVIPARLAGATLDYEALAEAGAMIGSGGLVVFDQGDCMVDAARASLRVTQAGYCGQCRFCRAGRKRMLEILERLCSGAARADDLRRLEVLAGYAGREDLCGPARRAPGPVTTTLRHFRDEYEAHLREKRCPAGRCRSLIEYRVTGNCVGCTRCAQVCPAGAIVYRPYERHTIDGGRCTLCDKCRQACLEGAIQIVSPRPSARQA